MSSITRKLATGIAVTGTAALLTLAAAGTASAEQNGSYALAPGQGHCVSSQYAGYQVRADVVATQDGARITVLRDGAVVAKTSTRVTAYAAEFRTAYRNFPGAGYYTVCAQNTGSTNTIATLRLRTDREF